MRERRFFVVSAAALAIGSAASASWGQLPDDRSVSFWIRKFPTQPLSFVTHEIRLDLHAVERSGNWIGWEVERVRVTKFGLTLLLDKVWTEIAPDVPTEDGLWWVHHPAPMAPDNADFSQAPAISGRASAHGTLYADLDYSFAASVYVPPPSGSPYSVTVALSYSFQLANQPQPDKEGDDEPTEVPDGSDPTQ